jgi:predicted alpha/beta-fold hydrolase
MVYTVAYSRSQMGKVRYTWQHPLILRIYLRIQEKEQPIYAGGMRPGYGTISLDITPPLSHKLPATKPTVIYLSGLLSRKDSPISRWQIDPLADPSGPYGYRVVFVNFRGLDGNPVTSARIFDPNHDNDDLAATVTYIHSIFPDSPLIGSGQCVGGAILMRYPSPLHR